MKKTVPQEGHAASGKRSLAAASKESTGVGVLDESAFAEIVGLIHAARQRAYQAVNTELVGLYWQVGGYISSKLAAAEWGEGVVDRLAHHLARVLPGQRGFTRRNLFRMRQFFEIYQDNEKVTPLVTQLLSPALIAEYQTKLPDKRLLAAKLHEFYALNAPDETRAKTPAISTKGSRTKAAVKAKTGRTKPKGARS